MKASHSASHTTRLSLLLTTAVSLFGLCPLRQISAAEPRPKEYLVTPETSERKVDRDGVVIPKDVWKRFGSGRYRGSFMVGSQGSNGRPDFFFSPSGDTLYISGGHDVTALEPATGLMRFEYRYGGQNIATRDLGADGIRIEFHQGPKAGTYVVLEHGTGREIANGPLASGGLFLAGRREIKRDDRRQGPRGGETKTHLSLHDVATGQQLAELGKVDEFEDATWLSPTEERVAVVTFGGDLRIFDAESGKLSRSLSLGSFGNGTIRPRPVWSHDGKSIIICQEQRPGSPHKKYRLVEVFVDAEEPRTIADGLDHLVSNLALSPDGKFVACHRYGFHDRRLRADWIVFHRAGDGEYCEIDTRPARTRGVFSPDSRSFWLVSEGGIARFDLATKQLDSGGRDALMEASIVQFSQDGRQLHAAVGDEIWTWDVASGALSPLRRSTLDSVRQGHFIRCLEIDSDGQGSVWAGESYVRYIRDGEQS